MLVRMPDTVVTTLTIAVLAVGFIVHLARQLRLARQRIAAQAEALRLQALDEGIGPHLRMIAPPRQLSVVDGLRLHVRRHLLGTATTVLAAVGVATSLLLPDGAPVESAVPDPDPPRAAPAPSTPDRPGSRTPRPFTPTTTAAQSVTTTTPTGHRDHYVGTTVAASSPRPRRAGPSTSTSPGTPTPASSAASCMLNLPCDVVGMLLAS